MTTIFFCSFLCLLCLCINQSFRQQIHDPQVTISARIKRDKSITICMQWISTFRDRERERMTICKMLLFLNSYTEFSDAWTLCIVSEFSDAHKHAYIHAFAWTFHILGYLSCGFCLPVFLLLVGFVCFFFYQPGLWNTIGYYHVHNIFYPHELSTCLLNRRAILLILCPLLLHSHLRKWSSPPINIHPRQLWHKESKPHQKHLQENFAESFTCDYNSDREREGGIH